MGSSQDSTELTLVCFGALKSGAVRLARPLVEDDRAKGRLYTSANMPGPLHATSVSVLSREKKLFTGALSSVAM